MKSLGRTKMTAIRVRLPAQVAQTIESISQGLALVEAEPTARGRPAGEATGGRAFESQVKEAWRELAKALVHEGCQVTVAQADTEWMTCIAKSESARRLYIPGRPSEWDLSTDIVGEAVPQAWAERRFLVSQLVLRHLGEKVLRFAPVNKEDSPDFYGQNYPKMFEGKTTTFDFTVACADGGVLQEKLLFEYKSAKSSSGVTVDGNAHERLSFQTLQYLEVGGMIANTSFNVIASSAFSRFKNKYHVTFNQQAVRLGDVFQYFTMRVIACKSEYRRFFSMLVGWLFLGTPLVKDYRCITVV